MKSSEYRQNIRVMVKNVLRKKVSGVPRKIMEEVASEIAISVHARFYGANVDGVGSPIWRDHPNTSELDKVQPVKDAQELLNDQTV